MTPEGRQFQSIKSASLLLLLLIPSILLIDLATEYIFPYLLKFLPLSVALLAAPVLHILLLFPLLYVFVVRPMSREIRLKEKAQRSLRSLTDELELRVQEQTAALRNEILERTRSAESLRLFRALMERSSDGIEIIDPATAKVLDVNEASCTHLGYTREELLSLRVFDFDPNVKEEQYHEQLEQLRGVPSVRIESVHRRKDGTTFPVEVVLSYVSLGREYVVSITRDITERLEADAERERLQMAIEHAAEGVVITTTEGKITYVNPAFERITGYDRSEALGLNPRILKSDKHDEAFYGDLWRTVTGGKVWKGTITNKRKDGSFYQEDMTISPVRDSGGSVVAYVAIKRDISKQLSLEAQFRQAQKMEAIGVLAAGIAHDFNNILAAIIGYTQLAQFSLDGTSELSQYLEHVEKASLRARDLVQQILTFSRQTESDLRPVRLDVLVKEVLKLLRASVPSTIEFGIDISPLRGTVEADPSQIHQVVMNLCTNAVQAMHGSSGILGVSLEAMDVSENTQDSHPVLAAGPWAKMTVSDTGPGIDPATVDRIFEPFFTTKQDQGGTGLGLSTAHGIVSQHGGHITVSSTVGRGTAFCVYLPLVPEEEESGVDSMPVPRGSGEHILIVDDEVSVAGMLNEMLERLGYAVTLKSNPVDALSAFRAHPDGIDVVITDNAMPQMTGKDLIAELRAIRPDVPILMATGFVGQIDAHALGISNVLLKPVLYDQLAIAVRAACDGARRAGRVPDRT